MSTKFTKPSLQIYVNKILNRVTFKIESGYYLELLAPGTTKLLSIDPLKFGVAFLYPLEHKKAFRLLMFGAL